MKKVGQFFKTLIPFGIMLGLQFVAMLIVVEVKAVGFIREYGFEYRTMITFVMDLVTETNTLLTISALFEVLAFITLSIIYFGKMKAKVNTFSEYMSGKSVVYIILLFVGVELICGCMLVMAGVLFPAIMEQYAKLMEMSGLGELSIMSTLLTLICAPLVEEIAMRGLTLKWSMELFNNKFYAANIAQAFLFGLLHGNIVQGTYAFFMGLVLGYVAHRYKSLWASIIGHLVFNFAGTYLVALAFGTGEILPTRLSLILLIGTLLSLTAFFLISKDKKHLND